MAQQPTIYLIHASDAPQHASKLQEIIQNLKAESRIENFSTLNPEDDLSSLSNTLKEKDLVLVLLTNQLEPQRERIESKLRNTNIPGIKIAEILVDNVKYDNQYITFPGDLRPIRNREDMDAAWRSIEQNLKNMFRVRKEVEPVSYDWAKYLKIAIPVILLGILLIWWSPWEGGTGGDTSTEMRATEVGSTFMLQIVDVFRITGRGTVVTGRISRGIINEGDEVVITGGNQDPIRTIVSSIERSGNTIENAGTGQSVGLVLRGVELSQVQSGMVIRKSR